MKGVANENTLLQKDFAWSSNGLSRPSLLTVFCSIWIKKPEDIVLEVFQFFLWSGRSVRKVFLASIYEPYKPGLLRGLLGLDGGEGAWQ